MEFINWTYSKNNAKQSGSKDKEAYALLKLDNFSHAKHAWQVYWFYSFWRKYKPIFFFFLEILFLPQQKGGGGFLSIITKDLKLLHSLRSTCETPSLIFWPSRRGTSLHSTSPLGFFFFFVSFFGHF